MTPNKAATAYAQLANHDIRTRLAPTTIDEHQAPCDFKKIFNAAVGIEGTEEHKQEVRTLCIEVFYSTIGTSTVCSALGSGIALSIGAPTWLQHVLLSSTVAGCGFLAGMACSKLASK